ncbi:hypothetical protein L1987_74764 [Smallanthus sonchifolius]|uniref:Uncharacterized protein n=1 Tax=Smallanthus sonchifolius TaxID=185202 RepID=A0ACB9A3G3_9ASTR|nr:hypothetical protein L1987_74764 [Smallanthus sonchifolius]
MTKSKIAGAKTLVSTIGSVAATAMVIRSVSSNFLPPEFRDHLNFAFRNFINKLSGQLTMVIYEYDGFLENEIYNATQVYLAGKVSPEIQRLKVTKNPSEKRINVAMEINESFTDVYNGVKLQWCFVSKNTPAQVFYNNEDVNGSLYKSDQRSLELTFHRKHRDMAVNEYLPLILNDAKTRKQQEKTVKLFIVETSHLSVWKSVNLDHPAKFATLAMDTDVKEMIMKDLDMFVERGEFYRRAGKAWKRGYLLYGPPGRGNQA